MAFRRVDESRRVRSAMTSLHDAVLAESILNQIVSNAESVQLAGQNMRRHPRVDLDDRFEEWRSVKLGCHEYSPVATHALSEAPSQQVYEPAIQLDHSATSTIQ